jgi:hypothetical protein
MEITVVFAIPQKIAGGIEQYASNAVILYIMNIKGTTFTLFTALLGLLIIPMPARSEIPQPQISISSTNAPFLRLDISNVTTGATYHVEKTLQLTTNSNWQEVYSFDGSVGDTNWNAVSFTSAGFYRVVREPYYTKVGQTATFQTHAHGVAGTAHILDANTIELRNFTFDGGGIDVRVILSSNSSFSPYTIISSNLVGTSFSDATVQFPISGINLDDVNYISIWCVPVGANFGDGMFQ